MLPQETDDNLTYNSNVTYVNLYADYRSDDKPVRSTICWMFWHQLTLGGKLFFAALFAVVIWLLSAQLS